MIKTYSVTLDDEVVKEAQEYLKEEGRKLSPVINNLLIDWNKHMSKFYTSFEKKNKEDKMQEEEKEDFLEEEMDEEEAEEEERD